jgi:hypothetical protein
MPLRKRIESELCAEWKEQSICYKELQREAEELVGNDDEESEAVFRWHAILAMEQASEFYDTKVKELQIVFDEVALSVHGVHDVHKDREKSLGSKIRSPSVSTEHLWALPEAPGAGGPEDEDFQAKKRCFEIWREDAEEKPRRTCLASFVSQSFMVTLEESALKDALREFLQMLVYIDRIRNFAILNSIIAIKVAQRHCSTETCKELMTALRSLPMFQMAALNAMVPEMEALARKLHAKLSDGAFDELPSSWSMHVCPFCAHTTTNAVVLTGGRSCCWSCVMENTSNALAYCPLTSKSVDIKELRLERVLVSFLRRFFPSALKNAPSLLTGGPESAEEAESKNAKPSLGMLAALNSPPLRAQASTGKVAMSRRQRRLSDERRPCSLEIEKLDLEVSTILKGLAAPSTPPMGPRSLLLKAKPPSPTAVNSPYLLPLRRRERSISEPVEPPNLDALFLCAPAVGAGAMKKEHVLEPRNLRGFPLCSATCWCIEKQAATFLSVPA